MATLDASMQAAYDKALTRAQLEKLYVRRLNLSSMCHYIVTNPTSKTQYLVAQRGALLECTCPAGQNDHYCKHRAAVRFHLSQKHARADAAMATIRTEQAAAVAGAEYELERANWLGMTRDQRAQWLVDHGA